MTFDEVNGHEAEGGTIGPAISCGLKVEIGFSRLIMTKRSAAIRLGRKTSELRAQTARRRSQWGFWARAVLGTGDGRRRGTTHGSPLRVMSIPTKVPTGCLAGAGFSQLAGFSWLELSHRD